MSLFSFTEEVDEKGLVPQPDIILLLVATPLLLTLVFVVAPLIQETMAGTISVQVNMERMYYPLTSENILLTLMNSEFEGERISEMLKYHAYYEGNFKVDGNMVNDTVKKYLDRIVASPNYLFLINTTDFEENITGSSVKSLKKDESHVSKINFKMPNLEKVRVELRIPGG